MMPSWVRGTVRGLLRDRIFLAVNVMGLGVAFAAVLAILAYIRLETGYDRWVSDGDRIARVHTTFFAPDRADRSFLLANAQVAPLLEADFPYVEQNARFWTQSLYRVEPDGGSVEEQAAMTDPSFLSIFDWPVVAGKTEGALMRPFDLVVRESVAIRLFGSAQEAVGKTVSLYQARFGELEDFTITAVLADDPGSTHLRFDFLYPITEERLPVWISRWGNIGLHSYVKLASAADIPKLQKQLTAFINHHKPVWRDLGPDHQASDELRLRLMPLRDLHLFARTHGRSSIKPLGDILIVRVMAVIAALILIIALGNYANLTSVRLAKKARSISLQKVLGASKGRLALQSAAEAAFIAILGLGFGALLLELGQPFLNSLIGDEFQIDWRDPRQITGALLLLTLVSGVSSLYPLLMLRTKHPAQLLSYTRTSVTANTGRSRSLLVISQFSIAIALILATVILVQQTRYAIAFKPGFDAENVLLLHRLGGLSAPQKQRFITQVRALPEVVSAAPSTFVPGPACCHNDFLRRTGQNPDDSPTIARVAVGDDFVETYGMRLLAGRALNSRAFPADARPDSNPDAGADGIRTANIMVTASATRAWGFDRPEDALGESVFAGDLYELTIVGVLEDFHFRSARDGILPYYLVNTGESYHLSVKLPAGQPDRVLAEIERLWHALEKPFPTPFAYSFAEDRVAQQYRDENRQIRLMTLFSTLAILVACLGLFGLASFTAERRTKEIGIRKVMGARVDQIVRLLTWQFSKPVLIANFIAWPAAYWAMSHWLGSFANRIDLTPLPFFAAGMAALLIAWITVSFNAIRVARANPIHALRYE